MLMDWKNYSCENVHITQSKAIDRFIAISIKIPTAVFTKLEQIILKFVWNYRGSCIAKAILRKKNRPTRFQDILQSWSNQDSMLLAQK